MSCIKNPQIPYSGEKGNKEEKKERRDGKSVASKANSWIRPECIDNVGCVIARDYIW